MGVGEISPKENRYPYVANSLNNLAGLYKSQGRYEDAETLFQQALTLRQEILGVGETSLKENRHPDVATSLNNLAFLYYSQGRYEAAEPLYQQALQIWMSTVGENHPHTQSVKVSLIVMKLQSLTGLDAAVIKQMIQNDPDNLIEMLRQIMGKE